MIFSVLDEIQDMMDDQKMDISRFSDESCILDVTWEVVYCSKSSSFNAFFPTLPITLFHIY